MIQELTGVAVRESSLMLAPTMNEGGCDQHLLARFRMRGDQAAFSKLVERHGPAVWRVCRRLLDHEQDAEDAFQAAFFVLARQAPSIRHGEAVGSWLYGVACRVAMKARRSAARRRGWERRAPGGIPEHQPWSLAACRELQRLLDEEVARLPEKYRAPFVLCCLEGMSRGEAAEELRCKEGTVSGRLARARQQLQRRLLRRGVTLSAVLTAGVLAQNSAAAAPVALIQATAAAALAAPTGHGAAALSPAALSLAEHVLRGMAAAKWTASLSIVLTSLLVTTGGALVTGALLTGQADNPPPAGPTTVVIDEQVLALAFSPDDKKLVTAGARHVHPGQFKVWDLASGQNLVRVRGIRGVRSVAYSPDGQSIATGIFGGEIKLRDPTNGAEQAVAIGHTVGVNSLAFSADGRFLATAGLDRVVKLWQRDGLVEHQAFHGHTDMVFSVAYFTHGRAIVSGGHDKTARIWDVEAGKEKFILTGHRSPVEMVAVSPDDQIVATASWDRTIKFWDAATGEELATLSGNDGSVLAIAFSPDGTLLASATSAGTVRLWDVQTRKVLSDLGSHAAEVWSVAFSHDGKLLASGSTDRTAKLWDVAKRTETRTFMTGEAKGAPLSVPPETGPPPVRSAPEAPREVAGDSTRPARGKWAALTIILGVGLSLFAWLMHRYYRRPTASAGKSSP